MINMKPKIIQIRININNRMLINNFLMMINLFKEVIQVIHVRLFNKKIIRYTKNLNLNI